MRVGSAFRQTSIPLASGRVPVKQTYIAQACPYEGRLKVESPGSIPQPDGQ
jgi:hypothetical protein